MSSEDNKDRDHLLSTLDPDFYRSDNIDLATNSDEQCRKHFKEWGYEEGRYASKYHKDLMTRNHLDIHFYKNFYSDLKGSTDLQARLHYIDWGRDEKRFHMSPYMGGNEYKYIPTSTNHITTNKRTLVIYVFHIVNERVDMFIENGIFFHPDVDFLFVCNDPTFDFDTLKLPYFVKTTRRENTGFDYGAFSHGVLENDRYKYFDNFIMLNSSCIGPCLPSYFKGKWTDIFIDGLKNDIKIFGSMINTMGDPLTGSHVQSFVFAMDKETLIFLINRNIFSMKKLYEKQVDCVLQQEVLMSQLVIQNGWNIRCVHPGFKDVDFSFKTKKPEDYDIKTQALLSVSDAMWPCHKNVLWEPYQIVFYKGNR